MSGISSSEESNAQAFSHSELKSFQTLECAIHNAFLEAKEFALYSVLETLLGAYAGSFTIFEAPDSVVFVHVTPQDTLTGLARVRLSSRRKSFRTIPDATVRVTRLYRNRDEKVHRMALVIEAKRLVGPDGRMPWNTNEAMLRAEDILPYHIPQLMFQAYSAWTESPGQPCLYVGILIGPYLTTMVFNNPPTTLDHHQSPPSRTSTPHDDSDDNESLLTRNVQHICDVFPQERAPKLVIYMKHIFKDPEDWKMGLSTPLRYIFHLATDVVKSFEPGISQESSRTFSFKGVPQAPYDVTVDEEVTFNGIIERWYKKSEGEKGVILTEGEVEDNDDDDYEDSEQPLSSPVAATKRKRAESVVDAKKRNRYGGADRIRAGLPS